MGVCGGSVLVVCVSVVVVVYYHLSWLRLRDIREIRERNEFEEDFFGAFLEEEQGGKEWI